MQTLLSPRYLTRYLNLTKYGSRPLNYLLHHLEPVLSRLYIKVNNGLKLSRNYWRAYVSLQSLNASYYDLNDVPVLCLSYQ